MYAGYVDDRLLFSAGMAGYEISAGTIHKEIGKCDSATIKLPPSNLMRDTPVKRASIIKICKDGVTVFKGCVADTSMDFAGNKTYNIDGAMMWMKDICKPPFTMTEDTMLYYATAIITQYNDVCRATKQIKLGTVDDTLPTLAVEQTEYKPMLSLLQDAAQAIGGTLCIRYDGDDIFLDVIKAYDHRCAQQIEISKNLLDLTDQVDSADLITRVYPLGKDGLTIASVNNNSTCLINADAEGLYGRIDGTLRVDTDDADALKAQAAAYLAQYCGLSHGIRVTAADLSAVDFKLESYHVGDSVRVVSPPHGIDTIMQVTSMDTSLVSEKDTMVLGWSNRTLTGAVASGGSGSSSGTTTSGGGGTIDVDSALSLDSTNPVQNKIVTAALASKAGKDVATQYINGLMSKDDKAKLDGIEAGANKTTVDAALDAGSTNPVQNKIVTAELDKKAGKDVATADADGLMSAADKVKLDGIEDGANKTIVDDAMSDTSTNPVQNKVIKQYVDEKGVNYFDTYVEKPTKEQLTAYADYYTCKCKATHTYAEIAAALAKDMVPRVLLVDVIGSAGANRIVCPLNEYYNGADGSYDFDAPNIAGMYGYGTGIVSISEDGADYTCSAGELPPATGNGKCLVVDDGRYRCGTPATATQSTPGYMSAADKAKLDGVEAGANKTIVDAALDAGSANPVQNKAVKAALDGKAGTAVATTSANGLMSAADKDKLDGVEAGATKTTVDAVLDAASENPVQNKAVKAALDGKLSTRGGEISGYLSVGLTVSAEGSVSTGKTSTDTGIHFEKAGSDVGRISHGSDPMTGVAPIARLKVASPTEDDDAATKGYVDGSAVRYDAAQELEFAQKGQARQNIDAAGVDSPQFQGFLTLSPANETLGHGVGLSPTGSGHNYTLDISDVDEGNPTLLTGVKTPTDANTNAATTVEYVKNKIAEVAASGGVDVDNALSATSTNPVQNKVVTAALTGKAGTAVATTSANGLMSAADKTKLDGVEAGATRTTVDAALDAASENPVQNKAVLSALDGKMDKSGGTFTGNVYGKYFCGTWLQSTAAGDLGRTPGKIAVLDDSGWVYYRTPAELLADIGAMSGGDYYTKAETDAAIAVRASTSAYGTTKLSNSTTSSSKTLAATPYAVKTALAQAKAYVDSAIAVAINSAY